MTSVTRRKGNKPRGRPAAHGQHRRQGHAGILWGIVAGCETAGGAVLSRLIQMCAGETGKGTGEKQLCGAALLSILRAGTYHSSSSLAGEGNDSHW